VAWYDDPIGVPTSETIQIGRIWTARFKVPLDVRTSLPPAKGTDISAVLPFTYAGCTGITGFGARVRDVQIAKRKDDGLAEMVVTVIEPQGYTADATGPELRGSRTGSEEGYVKHGMMRFISTNGTTGVPVPGTTYFITIAAVTESGKTGRICNGLTEDWNTVPGLCITTASFIGLIPYTAGDGPELRGSRAENNQKYWKRGVMLFVTTDGVTELPVPGTTYFTTRTGTLESGLTGRLCDSVSHDWKTIPERCISTATFIR